MTFQFEDDRQYQPAELVQMRFASHEKLTEWRASGEGPEFIDLQGGVIYEGEALNAFVASRTGDADGGQ